MTSVMISAANGTSTTGTSTNGTSTNGTSTNGTSTMQMGQAQWHKHFHRHPIHDFGFAALDGKEKWTAYRFTKNIYDIWMPIHLERICSAIDALLPNLEQSEPRGSGLSQGLESHNLADQSSNDAASLLEEAGSSHVDSPGVTPDTSLSQGAFKKPKKRGNMELRQ